MKRLRLPRIRWPRATIIKELVEDTCLVAGFFMVARGLWLIYPPAMWLVCGLLLMVVGLGGLGLLPKGGSS